MSQLAFKQLSSLGKTKVIAPYAFYHYSSRWGFLGDHLALHTALIYRNVRRHIVPCWKFCDQEASRIVWEKTDNLICLTGLQLKGTKTGYILPLSIYVYQPLCLTQ